MTRHDTNRLKTLLSTTEGRALLFKGSPSEMRALWIVDFLLKVDYSIEENRRFICEGNVQSVPEVSLSAALRPGTDGDMGLAHRLKSLVRDFCIGVSDDLPTFNLLIAYGTEVLARLKAVRDISTIAELERHLAAVKPYLENARKHHHPAEAVRGVLSEKVEAFIKLADELSRSFEREQRAILGCESDDPYQREGIRLSEQAAREAVRHDKRRRYPVVSAQCQRWVLDVCATLMRHPERCRTNVMRHRVYMRDIWETVKGLPEVAKYGIVNLEHFTTVYRSACRGRARKQDVD